MSSSLNATMHSFRRFARVAACSLPRQSLIISSKARPNHSHAFSPHKMLSFPLLAVAAGVTSSIFLSYCDVEIAMPAHTSSKLIITNTNLTTNSTQTHFKKYANHNSQYNSLLEEASQADVNALHALTLLVNDLHNHPELLEAGVLFALRDALLLCEGDKQFQLRLNVVRLLADLSKHNNSHSHFIQADIFPILDRIIAECVTYMHQGWLDWLYGKFSFRSEQHLKKPDQPENPSHTSLNPILDTGDAVIEYLSRDLSLPTSQIQLNLEDGIAYHVTRCIANIARDAEAHKAVLETNVLQNLCHMLHHFANSYPSKDEMQSETMRHNILAVSALCKSAATSAVNFNAHKALIKFAQCDDSVAQTYACGGIRNLARHSHEDPHADVARVHRELVVSKVSYALLSGMKAASLQTKTFAVLAFGDLMMTSHHKADIIRRRLEPAYESFSRLLTDDNTVISRVVSRVLVTLFGEDSVISQAPPELSKMVAKNTGHLVNGGVARGDLTALNAVRALCRDEIVANAMVDKGLIEILIIGIKKGSSAFLQHCTAALSSLSAWPQISELIVARGALKAVVERPCMQQNGLHVVSLFANLARNPEFQVDIARGGMKVLITAISSRDEQAISEGVRGLYNLSLGGVSRVMVTQSGAVNSLMKVISTSTGNTRQYAVGVLAEMSASVERATKLLAAGVVEALLKAAKEDSSLNRDVAKCISQLSQVTEAHGLLAKSGAVPWLVDVISRNGGRGDQASEVMLYSMIAVSNIAFSPGTTRETLRECGAVHLLQSLSSSIMNSPGVAKQALMNMKGDKPAMVPVENLSEPRKPV